MKFSLTIGFFLTKISGESTLVSSPRRSIDGKLCAAFSEYEGFVTTGCSGGVNPDGVLSAPWCYLDVYVSRQQDEWAYCAPKIDYIALRKTTEKDLTSAISDVEHLKEKLDKSGLLK